jgi:oligopeptide transport system substrate-binding protein
MKKKSTIILALFLLLSTFLAACGGSGDKKETGGESSGGTKPAGKQVLKVRSEETLPSLDPGKASDAVSFVVLNNVMEGLYRLDDNDKPVLGIAAKEPKKEGKKYTFTLRSDAKWSNGDPVTAKDFEFAWKRVVDPTTKSEYSYIMNVLKNAKKIINSELPPAELGVKAVNDTTLEVELENDVPYFLSLTTFGSFMPLNEKFVKEKGKDFALKTDTFLYNGPFKLTDWGQEKGWTYVKSDTYWDKDKVKLDEIKVTVIEDNQSAVNLYKTKELDWTFITGDFVDTFKSDPSLKVFEEATTFFIRFNQKQEVMKNKNARKALAMTFDKAPYVKTVLNNGSIPTDGLMPGKWLDGPDGKDFREVNGNLISYNAEEAKKAWTEAKKELGKDKIAIEFLVRDREDHKKAGEYLKEQMEKNLPGLTINLKLQPFKQQIDLMSKLDYTMTLGGWGADFEDAVTFLDLFRSDSGQNQMAFANQKFDELIDKAKGEWLTDLPKRQEALLQAEKILLAEEYALAPFYQRSRTYLERAGVKGIAMHQVGGEVSYKWASFEK